MKRLKKADDAADYQNEMKFIEGLKDSLQLADHGDFFKRPQVDEGENQGDEDEQEVFKIERISYSDFVLCGVDFSTFYRKADNPSTYVFYHQSQTMVNFKIFKGLWAWVVKESSSLSLLFVIIQVGEDQEVSKDLRWRPSIRLASPTLVLANHELYFLTVNGVMRFDLQRVTQVVRKELADTGLEPELVYSARDVSEFCVKSSALYCATNYSNTLTKVELGSLAGLPRLMQGKGVTKSLLLPEEDINEKYIKDIKIKPLDEYLVVCTSNKIILLDDVPRYLDHYLSNGVVDFTSFKSMERTFVLAVHRRQDLTILTVFRGGFFVIEKLLTLEDDRPLYYGILHIRDNSFLVYGQNNYQKLFALDFQLNN